MAYGCGGGRLLGSSAQCCNRKTQPDSVVAYGAMHDLRRINRLIEIEDIAQQRLLGRVDEARVDGVHEGQQRFVTRAVPQ